MWNWFRKIFFRSKHNEIHVIVESPSSYYRKTGKVHEPSDTTKYHIGNVVGCKLTERKAIITHVIFLPPEKEYAYRYDGIGFDGHGWWSHHAYFIAETLDEYLESLKNNECKI